jgi:hypothetical protein
MLQRVKSSLVLLGASALLGLAACSSSSNSLTPGCGVTMQTLDITVANDTNEVIYLCTATVTATGPSTVTLKPSGGTMCSYSANVTTGTYNVTATLANYDIPPVHVTVQAGCDGVGSMEATPSM